MGWRVYWSIFWRTFAALVTAGLLGLGSLDLIGNLTVQGEVVLLILASSTVGGLVAVGIAYYKTPAITALQKATRAAVEKLVGVVVAIPLAEWGDLMSFPKLLLAGAGAIILSFVVTFFMNQSAPPQPVAPIESSQG